MKLKQKVLTLFGFICGIFGLLFFQQPVFAQVVFSDDFSNGFEKWENVRNNFYIWSIVSQTADAFVSTPSTLGDLIPKDIYWNDSWKNYIYKLDYTYLEGADSNISFWFKDILNWYQIHFVKGNYYLSHVKNGVEIWRMTGQIPLESGVPHKMELHLDDGNIKFFMDEVFKFDYFDPTFDLLSDFGRIGLRAGAGAIFPTHVQFDNIEVSLISKDFILPIPVIKQIDPQWKNIEYDSASIWSPEKFGIGDWGCLITSINMLLNYYEIYNFPDGTEITPDTLNTWLVEQEDGFIGPGLVNWSAVSRLVKQIHDFSGGVKLEYSRVVGETLETAITEIQNNKPIILEIPGHFLVGHGFNQNRDDIYIADPAYSYSQLSEHQETLKSTRLLTPSNTDLSFIHMAHANTILVKLIKEDGEAPENYQTYSQSISNFSTGELSPEFILHEFTKPETGIYKVEVVSNNQIPQAFNLKIFAYDLNANLTNLTYSGIAGTSENPTTIIINYHKDSASEITSNANFENLVSDIQSLENNGLITKHFVAFELKQLAISAMNSSIENKPRYINALTKTINWYSIYLSELAKEILNKRLLEINTKTE